MNKLLLLLLLLSGCDQSQTKDDIDLEKEITKPLAVDSTSIKTDSQRDNNFDSSFEFFQKLIQDEGEVSISLIKRFVDTSKILISPNTKYIGKSVSNHRNYKFFYIKCGNKDSGQALLLTYNKKNKPIDTKAITLYCKTCSTNRNSADLAFVTGGKKMNFIIKYFDAQSSNVMPHEDSMKNMTEENWYINNNGFFKREYATVKFPFEN